MKKIKHYIIILTLLLPALGYSQEASPSGFFEMYKVEIVLALAVLVSIIAIVAMYTLLVALNVVLRLRRQEMGIVEEEKELIATKEGEEGAGFWRKFWNRMNDSVPIAKESEIATDHEYDGIRELDNRLPPWWLYGFYASILFGVIYFTNYQILKTGPTQDQEFQAEMMQAEEDVKLYLASMDNLIDESNVSLASEEADINAGKVIFEANCAVCHAVDGGGGVGPNLTDKYWLHGGDMSAIFKTIKYGVPSKGMISWETQLSPKKMQQVASYIYLMEGQETANPKEAQGELFERVEEGEETEEAEKEEEASEEMAELQ